MEIWDGTWGHFWPGIDFSKWWYSWAWPIDLAWYPQLSLGMSAVTIPAGKVNEARRALGYAEMVSNAKGAAGLGGPIRDGVEGRGGQGGESGR